MLHMFDRAFIRTTLPLISTMIAITLFSTPASAQNSNAAHSGSNAAAKKEVKFEVASIRPLNPDAQPTSKNLGPTADGFSAPVSLWEMIMITYASDEPRFWLRGGGTQVVNGPSWLYNGYVVNARISAEDMAAWSNQGSQHELLRSAMRALLKERCKLAIHELPTEVQDYKLVVIKSGPKFQETPPGFVLPSGVNLPSGGVVVWKNANGVQIQHYYRATMEDLAWHLSSVSGRPVHDATGLAGRYDFTIQEISHRMIGPDDDVDTDPIHPLGLDLTPGKGPGLTLVIDHIERPSPN